MSDGVGLLTCVEKGKFTFQMTFIVKEEFMG